MKVALGVLWLDTALEFLGKALWNPRRIEVAPQTKRKSLRDNPKLRRAGALPK